MNNYGDILILILLIVNVFFLYFKGNKRQKTLRQIQDVINDNSIHVNEKIEEVKRLIKL